MSKIELRNRLNSINSSFSKLLKLKINSPKYAKIGVEYESIIELALANNPLHSSNQIKLIELAARLGVIQCKINSFDLSPTDESSIQDNDAQLEQLKNELVQLNKKNTALQKEFSSRKSNTFTSQLKKAINSFEKDKRNIQAAYSYNFACHSLEETTTPPSPDLVKKSIYYLKKSSELYAQLEKLHFKQDDIEYVKKSKNETDIKIAETKKLLEQLQLNHYKLSVDLPRIKTKSEITTDIQSDVISIQKTSRSPAVTNAPDHPIPLLIAATEEKVQTPKVSVKNMPLNKMATTSNKRKHPPLNINKLSMPLNKIPKTNSATSIIDALTLLTISNEELLNLETEIFKEITTSLENAAFLPDNFFYLQLINNMAGFIQPHSNLDQLTRLRLAEIVLYFSKLSGNFEFSEAKQRILANEHRINSVYKDFFPLELRLDPNRLREKFQAENGLKSMFLSEIKTYYFNKKIAAQDNDSRKIFLSELQAAIESSFKLAHIEISRVEVAITEGTIEIISNHINNLPVESEHHCLTNVLQILKKFYISSDINQQAWLEENGIPIKPENSQYIDFLSKLLELVPAPTLEGKRLREDPPLIFFKPANNMLTKEIFLDKLKNHLLMLKRDYVTSNNKYSAICDRLTQLIINQIDLDLRPIWRPFL